MANLPPLNIIYPFDETGEATSNLIQDEVRVVPPINNRIIVPAKGAFYANSLIIRTTDRELVLNRDYELAGLYQEATEETGNKVNMLIYFNNPNIEGNVYLTYQVVGGIYTGTWESVQEYVNLLLIDPRKVRWDDVLNKPELYAPMDHYHDINDVYGLDVIPPILSQIRQAILRIRSKEMRKVYNSILQIKTETERLLNTKIREVNDRSDRFIRYDEAMGNINVRLTAINAYITKLGDAEALMRKANSVTELQSTLTTLNRTLTGVNATVTIHGGEITNIKQDITTKYNETVNKFLEYVKIITNDRVQDGLGEGTHIANRLRLDVTQWRNIGITRTEASTALVFSIKHHSTKHQLQLISASKPGELYYRNYNDATSRYITEKIATSFNFTDILKTYMRDLPVKAIQDNSSVLLFDSNNNPYKATLDSLRNYLRRT